MKLRITTSYKTQFVLRRDMLKTMMLKQLLAYKGARENPNHPLSKQILEDHSSYCTAVLQLMAELKGKPNPHELQRNLCPDEAEMNWPQWYIRAQKERLTNYIIDNTLHHSSIL